MTDMSTIIGLIISALVGIAVDIVLVVLLGMFAAGIGGRAQEGSPAPRRRPPAVFGVIALGIGAYLGVSYAWQLSYDSSGLGALLGTGITAFLVIGGAVHLGLIGVVALAIRHRRGSAATRSLFASAGGLVLGALAGIILAAPLGLTYRAPVFTERAARLDLSWYGEATFVPSAGSPATCTSVADGSEIAHVRGLSAGRVAEATVIVNIDLPASGLEVPMLDIMLTLTLPDGTQPGWWSGPVPIADLGPDGSRGRLTFSDLPLVGKDKGGPPSDMVESISGVVTWDCGDA